MQTERRTTRSYSCGKAARVWGGQTLPLRNMRNECEPPVLTPAMTDDPRQLRHLAKHRRAQVAPSGADRQAVFGMNRSLAAEARRDEQQDPLIGSGRY